MPGKGFISYQNFSNVSYCADWQGWKINNEYFMTMLQWGNSYQTCSGTYTMTNTIYKWNHNTQFYEPFQTYQSFLGFSLFFLFMYFLF